MKTLIISEKKDIYSVSRLKEELLQLKCSVELIHPFDSSCLIIGTKTPQTTKADIAFNRISGIRFDDYDLELQAQIEKSGTRCFNKSSTLKVLRDKNIQLAHLADIKAPLIPSLSLRGRIVKEDLLENLKTINATKEFVVKTQRGNQGLGINLLRGVDSLVAFLETFWAMGDQRLIVQPMIKFEKELRLFFIKDKFVSGIEKKLDYSKDFRANSDKANTFHIDKSQLSSELELTAKKLMVELDLFYAGFDFAITEDGEIKLLEVNPCPGFELLEKLSSKNIAKEIIKEATSNL